MPAIPAEFPWFFLCVAAVIVAGVGWWGLRAYRRAGEGAASPRRAAVAALALGAATFAVYAFIGSPGASDQPFAPRLAAAAAKSPQDLTPEEIVALEEVRARASPDDPSPYLVIGDIYAEFGVFDRAASAYQLALRRVSRRLGQEVSPEMRTAGERVQALILIRLGRVQVAEAGGQVSGQAAATFEQASALAPESSEPWVYRAMAAAQGGRHPEAVALWTEALNRMEADDPMRQMAVRLRGMAERGETPGTPPPGAPASGAPP